MSVNKVILLGHVGCEPEFKDFNNGGCVAKFTLATTRQGFSTKDCRKIQDKTDWHNIVAQNGFAKVVSQYVKKGDKLYIDGVLHTRSYNDANGAKRYITEIFVTNIELLSLKKDRTCTQQ